MIFLPAPDKHGVSYDINLEGTTYTLLWLWNERDNRWWLKVSSINGEQLGYTPVVSSYPLFDSRLPNSLLPPGEFYIHPKGKRLISPNLTNWRNFWITYIPSTELF